MFSVFYLDCTNERITKEYLVYWVTSSQTVVQLINVISSGLPTVLDFLKHKYLLHCIFSL